jgi:hypothetical protein
MGLRAMRHSHRRERTRRGGDFPARGQGDEGVRRARRRRLTSSINVASSSWAEFVTHVPGLFCYRCPRPFTATHSMTRSARCSSDGGIVRPIAFAVLRLITSSNLLGCSIGKSEGFIPLRILST